MKHIPDDITPIGFLVCVLLFVFVQVFRMMVRRNNSGRH